MQLVIGIIVHFIVPDFIKIDTAIRRRSVGVEEFVDLTFSLKRYTGSLNHTQLPES